MFTRTIHLAVTLALIACLASAAGAQVHDVTCFTGPNPTIQDGVNAAADGDIVVVHPCTIPYPAFTVSSRNNLQIVAADQPSNIISAFPIGVNAPASTPSTLIVDAGTCIRIEDSTNISVVNLVLEDCGVNGIEVEASRRVNLHGNELYGASTGDGVQVVDSRSVQVTGNFLFNAVGFGVSTDPGSVYVNVEGNRILFNGGGVLMEGTAVDVVNNEVRQNGGDGISVRSRLSKVSRNWAVANGGNQIDFVNWQMTLENCVVGNWFGGAGIFPAAAALGGCQAENF